MQPEQIPLRPAIPIEQASQPPALPAAPTHETARVVGGVVVISPEWQAADWTPAPRIGDVSPVGTHGPALTTSERSLSRWRTGNSILMDHDAVAAAAALAQQEADRAAAYHRLHMQADASLAEASKTMAALREASDEHSVPPFARHALGALARSQATETVAAEEPVTAVPAPGDSEPVTVVPFPSDEHTPFADETAILAVSDMEHSQWHKDRTRVLPVVKPKQPINFVITDDALTDGVVVNTQPSTSIPAAIHPPKTQPAIEAAGQTEPQASAPAPQIAAPAEDAPLPARSVTEATESASDTFLASNHDHAEVDSVDKAISALEGDVEFFARILESLDENDPMHADIKFKLRTAESELSEANHIINTLGPSALRPRDEQTVPVNPDDPLGHKERWENQEGVDTLSRILAGIRNL